MSAAHCKFCSCLLLWRVQCTGGKLSLKNYPGWRMSQVDQRCFFFFLNPCHLLFPISVKEFWKPCSSPQSPIVPVAEEGSQWSKGQTNPEQRRYIESQMNGRLPERMDSGAHRAECSRTLLCRPDSSLHPFPGAMKKSALDYSTVKTSILRRK